MDNIYLSYISSSIDEIQTMPPLVTTPLTNTDYRKGMMIKFLFSLGIGSITELQQN